MMNKKQLVVIWVAALAVFTSIFSAVKAGIFYSRGYRGVDRYGNIVHIVRVGRKNYWEEVLKRPLISAASALVIGGCLIYYLKDKTKKG
jgi:hypothetical protein